MIEPQKVALLFPNFNLFEVFSVIPHQPSLSLGYLAGMLDKHHIPLKIIDAAAERLTLRKTLLRIKEFNPIYVGITTNISTAYAAVTTAQHIRKSFPQMKLIMGGPWATAEAKEIIKRNYADIVVLGEGEYAIVDIAKTNPLDFDALKKIKGICFRTPNGIISTELRAFIDKLDDLPFPLWKYFPKKGYTRSSREQRMYPFITSRGCPYNCLNCTKIIHGRKMRYRSIENMIQELDYLKKIGAREIAIEDDMFNLDLPRIKQLLREIIRHNYNFRFQLSNGIRADHVDDEFAKLLYTAGTYRVALGIESGSQKVVDFLCKGLDLSVVPDAVATLQKAHIKVAGYFMMGLPVENFQSLIHSIDFADRINVDIFDFLTLVPFPGTRLYDYVVKHTDYKEKPIVLRRIANYQYAPMAFTTKDLTPKVMKRVKAYYFIRSYANPRKFLQFIASYTLSEFVKQMVRNVKIFLKRILLPASLSG